MTKSKWLILSLILSLFFIFPLWAQEDEAIQLLLLAGDIESSTHGELVNRLKFLNLSSEGADAALKERLYTYYGLTPLADSGQSVTTKGGYTLEIVNAQHLFVGGANNQFVLLEGDSQIAFTKGDEEGVTQIVARSIAIDLEQEFLVALSAVNYLKKGAQSEELLDSEILTVRWAEGSLKLSRGSLQISRESSTGEEINFYTLGEEINLTLSPRTITFEDGLITTNQEQAYFSIRAKKLFLVDGGDFFVTNATISMGRVPILWSPFLYYPGRTFIFNPAIGFESQRGFFFSTTTDIFGKTPKIEKSDESSLSALLSQPSTEGKVRDGWVYGVKKGEELTALEAWAKASDSYLSLLFDGYQKRGVMVGLDSTVNTTNQIFSFTNYAALAFAGALSETFSSYYPIAPVRYAFKGDWKVKTNALNLTIQLPFYSDPKFMRDYGDRLTSFSLGALTGSATFPSVYKSDITSFNWRLDGSATIPTKLVTPYVKNLKIERLSANVNWTLDDEGLYQIDKLELPNLSFSLGGTLLSLRSEPQKEGSNTIAPNEPEVALKLRDYGIEAPYSAGGQQLAVSRPKVERSSLSVDYSFKQIYNRALTLKEGETDEISHYSRSSATLNIKGALAPSLIQFSQRFDPLITLNKTEKGDKEQISVNSVTDITILPVGLSWGLSMYLFNRITSDDEEQAWDFGWTKEVVSRHQLVWSWPFKVGNGVITPALTTTLDPQPYSFKPALAYKIGPFSLSLGYFIKEDDAGDFKGEKATLAFEYNSPKYLTAVANVNYATDLIEESETWWQPLEISTSVNAYLFNSYLTLKEKSLFSFESLLFEEFEVGASVPWAALSIQGSSNAIDLMDASIKVEGLQRKWWKNRISFGLTLESSYRYSFWDTSNSAFAFKMNFHFAIAEFLTMDLAFKSVNNGFHRYETFGDMWEDLLRSFDFLGDGRRKTQFTMESIEFSLVHHMADWDLSCKYEGSIVLSDMEWHWQPVFSIYLNWKAIPEIEVDRQFSLGN
ncbi:MAG: hypothetical protein WCY78_05690 [Sphaerochaetaceae bacterium]